MLIGCCKDSANRTKNQIYLSFSELQPIFGETKFTTFSTIMFAKNENNTYLCLVIRYMTNKTTDIWQLN